MPNDPLSIDSLCADLDLPEWVRGFDYVPGGQVVFGPGKLEKIGEIAITLGAKRALIVTDPGIASTGAVDCAQDSLKEEGISVAVFDAVRENPTTEDVDRCVEFACDAQVDLIIGLGGGSSMDTAKGANFLLTNGGRMQNYQGVNRANEPMLPFIAVPTTSGTGSECQSFALIADAETHAKMACGDTKAAAAVAILDPELTLTMPRKVTAHTGIDAMAHALETAVCNQKTRVSDWYSKAAWALLDRGFEEVLRDPNNLEARARMQLGAAFAGTAIENSMLGIAHSCANPLTAHFGIIHGQAVGTMMPHVVEFNRADELAAVSYGELGSGRDLSERLHEHLVAAEMNANLAEQGVTEEMIPQLAEEASTQWTAQFNPRPASVDCLAGIYRDAFSRA